MYNGREGLKSILSYVDFTILCNPIKKFSEFIHIFVKEGITFPLLLGSRSIKWRRILTN